MDSDNEAPKDPGVCQQRYTEQDYEGKMNMIRKQNIKSISHILC